MRPYIRYKRGWIYFAIGNWQPFAYFGASGWACFSPRWLFDRIHSERRRKAANLVRHSQDSGNRL